MSENKIRVYQQEMCDLLEKIRETDDAICCIDIKLNRLKDWRNELREAYAVVDQRLFDLEIGITKVKAKKEKKPREKKEVDPVAKAIKGLDDMDKERLAGLIALLEKKAQKKGENDD